MESVFRWVRESSVYRSIVRHGIADTNRNRSLVVFENLFLHVHPVKVRAKTLRLTHTYWLGGITLVCSLVLIATGVLLMFYYHPSVPQAYRDMKELQYVVDNGMFLRNLHRWGAHLMVFAAFLHMLRVFYHRAYRPPRQFNWVVGVVLLIVTLLLSYTGYLLPWDQLAFWGVSVGTNMAKEARTPCCASTSCTAWSCRWRSSCSCRSTSGASARTAACRGRPRSPARAGRTRERPAAARPG